MPNHITNKLTIEQNILNEVTSFLKRQYDDGISDMDFEKIYPIPQNIYRGDLGIEERLIYGKNNWFDWCEENWGTKWNAYNTEQLNNSIYFDTAWGGVPKLMAMLSQKFKDHEFGYKFADEDTGSNVGNYIFTNGIVVFNEKIKDCSSRAYEIYLECKQQTIKDNPCLYMENEMIKHYDCDNCPIDARGGC